jgi:hypothetical protein
MVPVYSWLDPQRMSYGFGYGSPWSLAGLVHTSAEIVLITVLSSTAGLRWGGVVTVILSLTSGGGCPCHQIFALGPLCCRRTQEATYGRILEAAMPVGECPVMMETKEVAIGASLAIRRGFSYSLYSCLLSSAHTFMLPLEVVDPCNSLSTSLVAMPQWQDASWRVSWQAAW